MRRAIEADIEQAIADRTIIRSWPLRGTLHFVAAEDIHWMLKHMAPRTIARAALRHRQLELDEATFVKSNRTLARALRGGKQLTRLELAAALNRAGISTDGQRLIHILNRAALEGLVCYAVRRGKQFTFALLDEWLSPGRALERDEALAELARRYFTSHGPATLQDFVWWSGLTTADARAGVEMAKGHLARDVAGTLTYWLSSSTATVQKKALPTACLLPAFDEYTVAYKDRRAIFSHSKQAFSSHDMLGPTIILDGKVVGTWKRTLKQGTVIVTPTLFTSLKKTHEHALIEAARRYGAFLGLPGQVATQ